MRSAWLATSGPAGSTGSLVVSSVAQPSANRVFASYAAPLSLVLQDSVYSVSGDNAVFANVSVPASGIRLFDLILARKAPMFRAPS